MPLLQWKMPEGAQSSRNEHVEPLVRGVWPFILTDRTRLPVWWPSKENYIIGDCIEGMKKIPDKSIDLVLTDPPYGVDYTAKNEYLNDVDGGDRIQEDITGDNLDKKQTQDLWLKAFKEIGRIMKPGAVIYCFMPQGGDQMMMMMMMMNGAGIEPRHELIWLKNNHVLGRVDYAYIHEPILYAWKSGAGHKFYGDFQTSVLRFDRPMQSKSHPTEKPYDLFMRLITNSTLEGDVVLDPFLGSGTTLLACRKTNRVGLGFEIEPKYEQVIRRRMLADIPYIENFEQSSKVGE